MTGFLPHFVILMSLIVVLGFFNERVTKLTYEISLMLFSIVFGILVLFGGAYITDESVLGILQNAESFNIYDFLMDGVLCFMLFAGSCHMKLEDFEKQARPTAVLAILATLLGAVFYGLLFFAGARLLGLSFSLPVCLMFGSIVAPTDPIAATSILNKFGLPKTISFLIEGESLLNDGVGVALFAFFSSLVSAEGSSDFLAIMAREICGAVIVGVVVTFVCSPFFTKTTDSPRQIFTSLLVVSLSYLLCDIFEFSGAIACVVCGVLFSTIRSHQSHIGKPMDLADFDTFWSIIDNLLNSMLYVMLGISFAHILQMPRVILISIIAIVCNLIGRAGSLAVSTLFLGPIPDGYDKKSFIALLTWGGLRGGLCIALAMSTISMIDKETYHIILGGTYAIVFFTTVIQGLSMTSVYHKIEEGLKH